MSVGFQNGEIKLDEEAAIYYSGQIITGNVVFQLDRTVTFGVIYIQFRGEANVLWTEKEIEIVNGVERQNTIEYIGHEDYFNYTENLIGGSGTSQLPPGHHSIPFKYQITSIAPSSFKGSIGQISYCIKAVLMCVDKTEELIKGIEVVAPFDLNYGDPSIKQPIDMEFDQVYGCSCFCSPDPVSIHVRLPVAGYCPGQAIPVAVEVQNDSHVEITKMKFELLKKEIYRSRQPISEYILPEEVIARAKTGAIMGKSKSNTTCNLLVPEFIAPNLENCGIINMEYLFRITIKLSGCNDELREESEICLGLVPLREFTEGQYIHPLSHSLPKGPIPLPNEAPPTQSNFIPQDTKANQFNPLQSTPYSANPPPYPTNNPLYPSGNKFETPQTKQPFRDYDIGFKASDSNSPYPDVNLIPARPPYPTDNFMPSATPPYPRDSFMPSASPPYPKDNLMPRVHTPNYPSGGFRPSAPPPPAE